MATTFQVRPDEQFVDPKTGIPTKRFLRLIQEMNALLNGLAFSNITGTISLAQLVAHKTTHQSGGSDAIKLDDLAAPDNNTDLNATTGAHGLLPRLSGNAGEFLNGEGNWV